MVNSTLSQLPTHGETVRGWGLLPLALAAIGRVNGGLALPVALFPLRHYLRLRHVAPRERVGQEAHDIRAAQQRLRGACLRPLLQQQEQRHHHQGGVMVPAAPAAHLVVCPPHFAFGVLNSPFHPGALPLALRQHLPRRVGRRVAQSLRVFPARGSIPPPHPVPATGLGFLTVPHPHPRVQPLDFDHAFG